MVYHLNMKTNILYNDIPVLKSDIDRFWRKVDKTQNCWNWSSTLRSGYGMFSFNGRPVGAHRMSYAIANGSIMTRQFVLHGCDNPQCVNPEHLRLGDHLANSKDKCERDRTQSNISSDQVSRARAQAAGGENLYAIAQSVETKEYKNLLNAIRGVTFRHVVEPPVPQVDITRARKVRKLSSADILEIQESLKSSYWGIVKKLAKQYNVSHTTISQIRSNRYNKRS